MLSEPIITQYFHEVIQRQVPVFIKVLLPFNANTSWHTSIKISMVRLLWPHNSDVTMTVIASQITGVSIVLSTDCTGAEERNHQSSTSLAFVSETTAEDLSIWWRHNTSDAAWHYTVPPTLAQVMTSRMFDVEDLSIWWRHNTSDAAWHYTAPQTLAQVMTSRMFDANHYVTNADFHAVPTKPMETHLSELWNKTQYFFY